MNEPHAGVVMAFRKILLIPTSDTLDQAPARRLLELAGSECEVEAFEPVYNPHLEAYPLSENKTYERLREELVDEHLTKADALAKALEARGVKASPAASWDYPLYESVVRRALKTKADLVVTEPLEGRAGALSHNDWRLISACPVAVLFVKSSAAKAYERIVAAVDPFHGHAKPGGLDEAILAHAKTVQKLTGAQLSAVHCFVPLTYMTEALGWEHLPLDDAEMAMETSRRDALVELVKSAGLDDAVATLMKGRPDDALRAMAERGETDLIVMGGLSRGRFRDFVVGSTAERILYHADVDVLVVKPPDFETTISEQMPEPPLVNPIYYPF